MTKIFRAAITAALVMILAHAASAQNAQPASAPARSDDQDLALNLAQPDFTLLGLPTTLRLPRHKAAFRVTHRFTRPLGNGSFGSLASDFFGLDSGAQIG